MGHFTTFLYHTMQHQFVSNISELNYYVFLFHFTPFALPGGSNSNYSVTMPHYSWRTKFQLSILTGDQTQDPGITS